MNQHRFEDQYQAQWDRFGQLLDFLESKQIGEHKKTVDTTGFPAQYRQLCNHYSLAQSRHYSPALVDKLHDLVLRGHRQLYKKKSGFLWAGLNFILREFPRTLRRCHIAFWSAFVLFYGPAVILGISTYKDPVLIYALMDEASIGAMESMYDPEQRRIGRSADHDSETDFTMFGFYILNNISIGFRTFAGGILFGIGSIFFLVYNGLMIGGVAGHLSHPPYVQTFWQFVSGHGAFELTAIVISGAAGLMLGYGILCPGPFSRLYSLRQYAKTAIRLIVGAAVMLLLAAFVEAFWSSSGFAPEVKFVAAALNWTLVIVYLLFAGRGRNAA